MTDNLPDVVRDDHSREVATQDVDSWIPVAASVFKLADYIAGTEFVPKSLRNSAPATAAAILYGREVGLSPMTALTQTHVIEGKPAISAEGMRALVLAQGHELVIDETTGATCTMRARRAGSDNWTKITWTIDMARAAGVAGKQVWKSYPRQMLQARCTTELVRLVFPDVIHGFRSVEELEDLGAQESAAAAAPAENTTKVTRQRKSRAKTPPAAHAPSAPQAVQAADDGPPLPGEPGYDDAPAAETSAGGSAQGEGKGSPADRQDDSGAVNGPEAETPEGQPMTAESKAAEAVPAAPEPSDDGEDIHDAELVPDEEEPPAEPKAEAAPPAAISRAQQRMLFVRLNELDVKGDEERLLVASGLIGRDVTSFNQLTKRDGSHLIETLARVETRAELDALIDAAEQAQGGES